MDNLHIVLVKTTHPGNIGAAARAMKTMGLQCLRLVSPQTPYPSAEITARAAGADSVLEKAQVFETLEEAIRDCQLVIGTGAQQRSLPLARWTPRACADAVMSLSSDTPVAIVFGTERSGLTNEEFALCQRQVVIPTHPDYTSLNLAAAVQIMSYELFLAASERQIVPVAEKTSSEVLATAEAYQQFYQHLEETLLQIEFIKPGVDKKILPRLKRLFNRACLEKREIDLLRGFLKAI